MSELSWNFHAQLQEILEWLLWIDLLAKIGAFIVSLVELKSKILFSYANSKGGVFQWFGNYRFTGRSVKTTHFTMLIDESLLNSSLTGGGRRKLLLLLLMLSHQP